MKMVSQLTRQAMLRHRLLASASYLQNPAPVQSEPCTAYEKATAVRPLYAQAAIDEVRTLPVLPPARIIEPAPQQNRQTIYGELMKKHDRFTERHLRGQ